MSDEQLAALIQPCMGMVYALARSYGGGEDLIQDGIEGLLKAAVNFDPGKGPFKPYARLYVMKAVSSGARYCSPEIVEEPGSEDSGFSTWEIRDAVERLGQREQRIVRLYYGIGGIQKTTVELAKSEGLSEVCIRQILCRARKKLRDLLS